MTLDELVTRYWHDGQYRREGRGRYMVCCPVHADKTPSMSLAEGDDGKILVRCFGCGAGVEQLAERLGVDIKEFFGPKRELSEFEKTHGIRECVYVYTDAQGRELFAKERRRKLDGGKTFLQSVPAPAGSRYPWKMGSVKKYLETAGIPKPLYRLPELIQGRDAGEVLWWVEGEKDVETMRDHGFVATTTADGAGTKLAPHYADYFTGARVVMIVPDNDKPPEFRGGIGWQGQTFAREKRKALTEAGVNCRVLELPDTILGHHVKDVTDYFEAGGTETDLRQMAERLAASEDAWLHPADRDDAPVLPDPPEGVTVTKKEARAKSEKALHKQWSDQTLSLDKRVDLFVEWLVFHVQKRGVQPSWVVAQAVMCGFKGLKEIHRNRMIAEPVIAWLAKKGRIYYHAEEKVFDSEMFFSFADKSLVGMTSDWFSSWLSREVSLNRKDSKFEKLLASIQDEGLHGQRAVGVLPEYYYCQRNGRCYISCGIGQMARISANKVEMVDNGTDGVLFGVDKVLLPWKLTNTPRDPFSTCNVWTGMETSASNKLIFKLWAMLLPLAFNSKPPLSVTGGAGSGKTAIVRGLFRLFGMVQRSVSVDPTEKGEAALWVQLNGGGLLLLDNVDVNPKWFSNTVEAASTGASKEMKKLYTNADIMRLEPRAAIAITSLRSIFASSQALSDRMLHIALNRVQAKETKDSELYKEIDDVRDDAMTYIAWKIAAVLADNEPVRHVNRRHPDFGAAALRMGRAIGQEEEAYKAMRKAETDKFLQNLKSDTFGELWLNLVRRNETFTAADFVVKMRSYDEKFVERHDWNSVKVGKAIERLRESLVFLYGLTTKKKENRIYYTVILSPLIVDYLQAEASEAETEESAPVPVTPVENKEGNGATLTPAHTYTNNVTDDGDFDDAIYF